MVEEKKEGQGQNKVCGKVSGVPGTAATLWDSWTECVKSLTSTAFCPCSFKDVCCKCMVFLLLNN